MLSLDSFVSADIAQATLAKKENGLYEIDYHTNWADDSEYAIFPFIAQAEIAPFLSSLTITSEDEGINGTQYWDLSYLLQNDIRFPELKRFVLPLNADDNHHGIIVTFEDSYDENGALGKLLDVCPKLRTLHTPSAPNQYFFERERHTLEYLRVQTGFAHQDFITNLANSNCFPNLKELHFTDYAEEYMDDFKENCVEFKSYEALLKSANLPALKKITLQGTQISQQEKQILEGLATVKNISLSW